VFGLRRSRKSNWLQPRRGFRSVLAAAQHHGELRGIDSLDLLVAALNDPTVSGVVADLHADGNAIAAAARSTQLIKPLEPGFTDEAKQVIEASVEHAMVASRGPDAIDILVGLARVDCAARQVLRNYGVVERNLLDRLLEEPLS
jgi:hypothetical protein